MEDRLSEKAREAGAQTPVDIGIFLVGVAAGGIVDSVVNVAGFAEPFVFASFTGGGCTGPQEVALGRSQACTAGEGRGG